MIKMRHHAGTLRLAGLLHESSTESDGEEVESVRVWCASIGAHFMRLNPITRVPVFITDTDTRRIISLMCDTECYLHLNRPLIDQFCMHLLSK